METPRTQITYSLPLMAGLLIGCLACGAAPGLYEGDGKARSGGSWLNRALMIEFDEFSLGEPYEASYQIERVPPLRGNELRLGIVPAVSPKTGVRAPWWADHNRLGTLEFVVLDETGAVLLDCKSKVEDLTWRRFDYDAPIGTKLVGECRMAITAVGPQSWTVRYTPGEESPADAVRVRAQAGGSFL